MLPPQGAAVHDRPNTGPPAAMLAARADDAIREARRLAAEARALRAQMRRVRESLRQPGSGD